jgi:RecG-like helicase
MTILSMSAQDETGKVTLKWFNQPYRSAQAKTGEIVYACGRVIRKNGVSLINPSISQGLPGIVPVYSTVQGVNQRAWRDSIMAALEKVWDRIPNRCRERCWIVTASFRSRWRCGTRIFPSAEKRWSCA